MVRINDHAVPERVACILRRWNAYFGRDNISNWRRLVADLGLEGNYGTKEQCREAVESVYVNIFDFFYALDSGTPVPIFDTYPELIEYTMKNRRTFPCYVLPKGCALRALLKVMY